MSVHFAKLGDLAEINPRVPKELAADASREVDFIPMSQLSEQGVIETNGSKLLGEVMKGYNYFANGDVIVAKITPCMENGKAAFVRDLPHGIAFGSTEFHVLRPGTQLDGRYLFYMLWNDAYRHIAKRNMTGTAGQKRVPKSFLERFTIPLPPLSEQKRIADILDKADAIRRKRQEAIDVFELLRASVFNGMFANRLRDTKWSNLSDYLVELRYGTSNKSGDGGYVALRIPNIVRGIIDLAELKTVDVTGNDLERLRLIQGDILFVRTNGNPDYVGRCAVFNTKQFEDAELPSGEIIYASYLIRARLHPNRLSPVFLQSFLQTSAGRKNVREKCRTSAGQYNINTKGIGSLKVPNIPFDEQVEFEIRMAALRSPLAGLTTAQVEMDDLFNSLVQRAFKGEL